MDHWVTRDPEPRPASRVWIHRGIWGDEDKVGFGGAGNVRENENTPLTAWGTCKEPQKLKSPSRTPKARRPAPTVDVKKASKNHGSEHPSQQDNVY